MKDKKASTIAKSFVQHLFLVYGVCLWPFELIFGKPCLLPPLLNEKPSPIYNAEQYYKELHYKLSQAYEIARLYLEKSKSNRVKKSHTNIHPIQIVIGDLVWLECKAHHKLGNLRIGPYEVIEIKEPNATIQDIRSPNNKQTVNKNRLKLYNNNRQ